jgi:hypothetical protein
MTTMLPPLIDREGAAPSRTHHSNVSTTPPPTAHTNACLIARIGWCHRQAMNAMTASEMEEWWAEKQGLIDALLHRDSTYEFEGRPVLRLRYTMGLEDGGVLIRTARVRPSCHHSYSMRLEHS